jgi:signal peptidase I
MSNTANNIGVKWGNIHSNRDKGRGFLYYLKILALALIAAVIIKDCVVEAYKIPSESMQNTLLVGDFLLANRFIYGARIPFTDVRLPSVREPETNDVIVFLYPENHNINYVKRIVAKGGDTVEIIDKRVYVNGFLFTDSNYAIHSDPIVIPKSVGQPRDNYGPFRVPLGQFFVMGDNRDNSADSRYWGCVPRDLILGKAFMIHWSWINDDDTPVVSITNPLSILYYFGYNIRHLPDHVRWNRIFSVIS